MQDKEVLDVLEDLYSKAVKLHNGIDDLMNKLDTLLIVQQAKVDEKER